MGWLSRLLGNDTAGSPPAASARHSTDGWAINDVGNPVLDSSGWRITVIPSDSHAMPLWEYCAVKNDDIEWSLPIPSQELAKRAAEIHAKIGHRPPFGILTLEESDGESFEIVGESHYQTSLETIAGPKSQHGAELEVEALLLPEPENQHDPQAIQVVINDLTVGYIPRSATAPVHALLERTGATSAICNAAIVGGWVNAKSEGSFGVQLDIAWPPRVADE